MQESYRSLKRHGHFRIIATPYSMVIFQGVAIMLPGIAGDAAAVWHPRETVDQAVSQLGPSLTKTVIKAIY